ISTERVTELVERWIYRAPLPILASMRDERLHQMLGLLRRRGYSVGLLSDYPVGDKLSALGLPLELFDAVVEAGEPEVNSLKPNPKGFLTLCQRLQLEPRDILYVGDRESIDGAGARAVGMQFALCAASRFDRTQSKALTSVLQLEDRLGPCTPNKTPRGPGDCWLCGSSSHVEFAASSLPENPSSNLVRITDFHYGQTGHLLKCVDCGFVFADAESVQAIEPLYSTLVDPDYQESAGARERAFAHIVRRIREIRPAAKTLLDVGAGLGGFCLQSQGAGFEAEGVEPSAWAVAQGQTNGVTLHHGYFPDALSVNKKFDVITVLDVIEHVGRPVELLDACRKHLNPGGLLVVVTPDIGSITARLLGRRWWHFRFAHIGYFSRRTMRAALGTASFKIDAVEPYTWWFQSGYLLERVAQYVPGGALLAKVAHSRALRSLTAVELPVRLYDSFVFYATTSEATHGA
ncbi:MAG: HAD-IA family hydrolase, partial [Candidatus Binataceae bacterium]